MAELSIPQTPKTCRSLCLKLEFAWFKLTIVACSALIPIQHSPQVHKASLDDHQMQSAAALVNFHLDYVFISGLVTHVVPILDLSSF